MKTMEIGGIRREAPLKLHITGKGSESFYRETVNVITQYRSLIAKPDKKLKDNFKVLRSYVIVCAALCVICIGLAMMHGLDQIMIFAVLLPLLAAVFSAVLLKNLNKLFRNMMDNHRSSILTFDDQGVELAQMEAQTVRLAWSSVAFVRVFSESVCVLSKDIAGFVISVDRQYENDIIEWLKANRPDVTVI